MIRLLESGFGPAAVLLDAAAKRLEAGAATDRLAAALEALLTPALRAAAPRGPTGDLAGDTRAGLSEGPGTARTITWTSTPYARFVVEGTGIYHAPDRHAEWDVFALQAFAAGGKEVVTMHTHHRGQRPNPYPAETLKAQAPAIAAALAVAGGALFVSVA